MPEPRLARNRGTAGHPQAEPPRGKATPKCDDLVACPAGTVEACILPLFEQEKAAGSTLLLLRSVVQVTEFSGDCGLIDRANHAQLSVFP